MESQQEIILKINVYTFYKEYFIDPFTDQLIGEYPEKTPHNKFIVQSLIKLSQCLKINLDIVRYIDKTIIEIKTNKIINSMESLWKSYYESEKIWAIYINKPNIREIQIYNKKIIKEKINEYYCEPLIIKKYQTNEKEIIMKDINEGIDLALKYNNAEIPKIISKKIKLLKEMIEEPYSPSLNGYINFSYNDFSNKDLRKKCFSQWSVNGSKFNGTKFSGKGHTGHCIHWEAKACDFTDAKFKGEICNKTSVYDGSNFTRVNLTTIMFNVSEVRMKNCNFTDSYVIKDGEKLMGKELIKYLSEIKKINIKGFRYDSPKDEGYHKSELDESIWSE